MLDLNFAIDFPSTFFPNHPGWAVVSHTVGGSTVVRHPEHDIVVKYGRGVTEGEAEAQKRALAILDPAIIYVPQVYGFFHDDKGQIGHLVMERVDGVPVDEHSDIHIMAVEAALNHIQSVSRDFPGPLHSGQPQGVLWENSAPIDNTTQGLENWINMWQGERISLQEEKFIFCHLDTALKNMLYLHDGRICLLDWASAGYYPRYFELAAHLKKGNPDQPIEKLLQSPRVPFSAQEEKHLGVFMRACTNSMAYARPGPPTNRPHVERRYLLAQPAMPDMCWTEQQSSFNATSDASSVYVE